MNTVVPKRHQVLLIDGIPDAQFRRNAAVEVVKHIETIRPLRGRREPKQLNRLDMLKQRHVRGCGRMVELVDNNHVKVPRVERTQPGGVQTLNRSKHVLEALWTVLADPQLAEAWIPQCVPEGRSTLFQSFLTVRHKQQTRSRQKSSQADEVDRSDNCLASSGRRHNQVPVMPTESGELDLLEQALLEGSKVELCGRQFESRPTNVLRSFSEHDGVIWQEIATLPIRIEDRSHLGHDIRVAKT